MISQEQGDNSFQGHNSSFAVLNADCPRPRLGPAAAANGARKGQAQLTGGGRRRQKKGSTIDGGVTKRPVHAVALRKTISLCSARGFCMGPPLYVCDSSMPPSLVRGEREVEERERMTPVEERWQREDATGPEYAKTAKGGGDESFRVRAKRPSFFVFLRSYPSLNLLLSREEDVHTGCIGFQKKSRCLHRSDVIFAPALLGLQKRRSRARKLN